MKTAILHWKRTFFPVLFTLLLSAAGVTKATAQVTLTQTTTSDFLKGTGQNVVIADDQVSLQAKMTDIYDYEATTNLPQNLRNHQTVAWQSYVFCLGGNNGSSLTDAVYRAELQNNGVSSWTTLNPMPEMLENMAVVATQKSLIVIGGTKSDGSYSDKIYVASIDPINGELGNWSELTLTLPEALSGARAITVHDNIYLIGGATTDTMTLASNKVYFLKLNSRGNVASIAEVTALPEARNGHAVATYDSKIYVMGGHDAAGTLKNTVYSVTVNLDGTLGVWQTQTAMPIALKNHTAVCTNGILAFIGGMGEELPSSDLYYTHLDEEQLTWTLSSVVLTARTHSGASFVADKKVYFTGGQILSGSTSNSVRYSVISTGNDIVGKGCFVSMPFDMGYPIKNVQDLSYSLTQSENTSYEVLYRLADSNFVFGDWISAENENPVSINATVREIQYMFRLNATSTNNISVNSVSVSISGYTQLAGNLNDISVLSVSNSPYLVTEDITFTSGIHDIEAGTVIYFTENTGLTITSACVRFNGTEEAPILISYINSDQSRWKGLYFQGSNNNNQGGVYNNNASLMNYTTVENAGYGENEAIIYFKYSNAPTFSHCIIDGSAQYALKLENSSPAFTDCTISNNVKSALYLYSSSPTLTSTNLLNSSYAVYISNSYSNPNFTSCVATGNNFGVYSYTPNRSFTYDETTLALYNNDIEIHMAGGTVSSDQTWNYYDNGYWINGDLEIYNSSNPVLNIAAGNTIRMTAGNRIKVGYGSSSGGGIHAVGTETDSIVFTAQNGEIGGWEGFYFDNASDYNSSSALRYCVIENATTNIYCTQTTQPSLMYSTVRNATNRNVELNSGSEINIDGCNIKGAPIGLYMNSGCKATMVMTHFENITNACVYNYSDGNTLIFYACTMSNANYGIKSYPDNNIPSLINSVTFNEVIHPIGIFGGYIDVSRTWGANEYHILDDIDVYCYYSSGNVHFTLEPGSILKFAAGKRLRIGYSNNYNGELYAVGTEEQPITFTSLNGEIGGWNGLYFDAMRPDQISQLQHCIIEKGNEYNVRVYSIYGSQLSMENCEIRNSNGRGVDVYSSSTFAPSIINCEIHHNAGIGVRSEARNRKLIIQDSYMHDNGSYGLYLYDPYAVGDVLDNLQFSDNSLDGICVGGGNISSNLSWPLAREYNVLGDIEVYSYYSSSDSARFSLTPGSTLKFAAGKRLKIGYSSNYNGKLYAIGTEEQPITFTSINGEVGGWNGLYFDAMRPDQISQLQHCIIEKATNNVYFINNTNAHNIENCDIKYANEDGVHLYNSSPIIRLSRIRHNNRGVYLENGSNPTIGNNTINGNDIIYNGRAVYQYGSNDIDMAYNFLGTVDSLYIENNLVYDKLDNNNKGRVNVFPVSMLPITGNVVEGTMLYDNNPEYPMPGSTIMVKNFADSLLYQTTTDATGHFNIGNMSVTGAKKLEFTPNVDVEATITTADALAVMLHYVHETMLTGSRLKAADVNGSLTVNGTDALLIQKRYVNQIETFPVGDVYYGLYDTVVYNNTSTDLRITVLCYGDVNGSYQALRGGITLQSEGQILVGSDQVIEIPVRVKTNLETGAISLKLAYPKEYLSIESVVLPNGEEAMLYDNNGLLTVSWYSLAPMYLSDNEALLTLVVRTKDLDSMEESIVFGLDTRSELADSNAIILNNVELTIPELVTLGTLSLNEQNDMVLSVYPNPMHDHSVIRYNLPAEGRVSFVVYDLLGNAVRAFEEGHLDAGQHEIELTNLASGVYVGRLAVSGSHEEVQIVKIVVE